MSATETIIEGGAGVAVLAGAAGMPQLDPSSFPNQIFWLVVALVAVYVILSRMALPRIAGTLATRKGTITSDLAAADELKQKAKAAEKAYTEALATARTEAAKIIEATKAEIQADLNAAIATADAEIAAKTAESGKRIDDIREGAMEAVAAVAKDTAGALVTALGGKADAMAIEAALNERLKG